MRKGNSGFAHVWGDRSYRRNRHSVSRGAFRGHLQCASVRASRAALACRSDTSGRRCGVISAEIFGHLGLPFLFGLALTKLYGFVTEGGVSPPSRALSGGNCTLPLR